MLKYLSQQLSIFSLNFYFKLKRLNCRAWEELIHVETSPNYNCDKTRKKWSGIFQTSGCWGVWQSKIFDVGNIYLIQSFTVFNNNCFWRIVLFLDTRKRILSYSITFKISTAISCLLWFVDSRKVFQTKGDLEKQWKDTYIKIKTKIRMVKMVRLYFSYLLNVKYVSIS